MIAVDVKYFDWRLQKIDFWINNFYIETTENAVKIDLTL